MSRCRGPYALLLLLAVGCTDRNAAELQRQQLALLRAQEQQLEEARRADAQRRAEEERRAEEQRLREEEQRRAQELHAAHDRFTREAARRMGRRLMDGFGGGQDLVTDVRNWRYDPSARAFEVDMTTSFNGQFVRSNNYWVTGRLTINEDGSNARFARTSANERFRSFESNLTTLGIIGGVVVLGMAAVESNEPRRAVQPPPAPVPPPPASFGNTASTLGLIVNNTCDRELQVAVRVRPPNTETWDTYYWYAIGAGVRTRLLNGSTPIHTDNPRLYYYAYSTDRALVWAGKDDDTDDRTYAINGQSLRFRNYNNPPQAEGNLVLDLNCNAR